MNDATEPAVHSLPPHVCLHVLGCRAVVSVRRSTVINSLEHCDSIDLRVFLRYPAVWTTYTMVASNLCFVAQFRSQASHQFEYTLCFCDSPVALSSLPTVSFVFAFKLPRFRSTRVSNIWCCVLVNIGCRSLYFKRGASWGELCLKSELQDICRSLMVVSTSPYTIGRYSRTTLTTCYFSFVHALPFRKDHRTVSETSAVPFRSIVMIKEQDCGSTFIFSRYQRSPHQLFFLHCPSLIASLRVLEIGYNRSPSYFNGK